MPRLTEAAKLYLSEWSALEESRNQVNDFFEDLQNMITERLKEAWSGNDTNRALYIWKDHSPEGRMVVGDLCENTHKCKIEVVILDSRRTGKVGSWMLDLYATNPLAKFLKNQAFLEAMASLEKEQEVKFNVDDIKRFLPKEVTADTEDPAKVVDELTEQALEHMRVVTMLDAILSEAPS